MADDIQDLLKYLKELDGRGGDRGPASEATLQLLAKHMGAMSGTRKGEKKEIEESTKVRKKEKQQTIDVTDRLNRYKNKLEQTNRGMFALYTGMENLRDVFLSGQISIQSFSEVLKDSADKTGNSIFYGIAVALNHLAKMVDTQVDNFKQLSEVGIQFSEGLFTTRELALSAGISLDAFTNAVATSADTLAIMSGSVKGGSRRFSEISNLLQKEFRSSAAGLGMTFEETTGLLTDYLDIQTSIGKSQFLSNRQLNAGAQEFILQLDQLASITGKQRKQIAEQLKADLIDKRLQGIFQSLESSAVPGIKAILGSLQGLPPATQDAVKELIGTAGVPMTDFAQSLIRLNPALSGFFRRVSMGQASVEEFEAMIRMTAQRSQAQGEGTQRLSALLGVLNDNTLAANAELFRFTEFGKQRNQVEQDQLKAQQAIDLQLLDFKNSLKDVQNFLITVLLPVLKGLGLALGGLAKFANLVTSAFTTSENAVARFVGAVGAAAVALGGLKLASTLLGATFRGLGSIFGKLLPSLGGRTVSVGASVAGKALGAVGPKAALGGVFAGAGIGALLGLSGAGAGLGIAAIGKGLQTFNNVNASNLSDVAEATKKLMTTLVTGITNPVDVTRSVSGLKDYAKTINQTLDDLDKDKLSVYTSKLEDLASAFREVNTSMTGAVTTTGRTSVDKLDAISTILQEIKVVMEDVKLSNKAIQRKTSTSNMYNT